MTLAAICPEHLKTQHIIIHVPGTWSIRLGRHMCKHVHAQTAPSITETFKRYSRIDQSLVPLVIPPSLSIKAKVEYACVCVCTCVFMCRMLVLCCDFALSHLAADINSYKQKNTDGAKQWMNQNCAAQKCPYIWMVDLFFFFFCREEEIPAAIWWQGFNCRFHSVVLSSYLLPSGAINNGRQSASQRCGECSHL